MVFSNSTDTKCLVASICYASRRPQGANTEGYCTNLLLVVGLGLLLSASLLLGLALLEEGLGDEDLVPGGDGTVKVRLVRSPAYTKYETERRWRIAAQVRHSQRWLTRMNVFHR